MEKAAQRGQTEEGKAVSVRFPSGPTENKRPHRVVRSFVLERLMGIEPTYPAWEAGVLPMNYSRIWQTDISNLLPKIIA